MTFSNSATHYGFMTRLLHWLVAPLILILIPLGFWMTGLDYYSPWYHSAPDWHKSLGLLVVSLMAIRWSWHLFSPPPIQLANTPSPLLQSMIHLVHLAFYGLIFALGISGYLIATAEGAGIQLFGWFEIPALLSLEGDSVDLAGKIHEVLAISLAALLILHIAGALKHHFIDQDSTLKRITKGDAE